MDNPLYIGIRFALYADLMLLFGVPLFALYTPSGRGGAATRSWVLAGLTALGLAFSVLAIAAMTASMAGVPLQDVDRASIWAMISETPMGKAWSVRMGALALFAASLAVVRHPAVLASLAGVALGSLAWTGHGAAGEGGTGTIQLIADLVHLLAAGAWLGALSSLSAMVFANKDRAATHRALDNFATAGTVIVLAVVGSGLANAFYLIGWSGLSSVPFTLYGQLLLVKLALFGAMIGLAAINRFWLTPALGHATQETQPEALRAMRRSLALESGTAIAILGVVAWLGTLEPSGSPG